MNVYALFFPAQGATWVENNDGENSDGKSYYYLIYRGKADAITITKHFASCRCRMELIRQCFCVSSLMVWCGWEILCPRFIFVAKEEDPVWRRKNFYNNSSVSSKVSTSSKTTTQRCRDNRLVQNSLLVNVDNTLILSKILKLSN